jgi:hypothetical protein
VALRLLRFAFSANDALLLPWMAGGLLKSKDQWQHGPGAYFYWNKIFFFFFFELSSHQ